MQISEMGTTPLHTSVTDIEMQSKSTYMINLVKFEIIVTALNLAQLESGTPSNSMVIHVGEY